MPITGLHFTDLGPFKESDFEFDSQVNVFTGPNNSGKSTVLWVLGELLVYPFAMPSRMYRPRTPTWQLSYSHENGNEIFQGKFPVNIENLEQFYSDKLGFTCYIPAQRLAKDFRSKGPTSENQVFEAGLEKYVSNLASFFPSIRESLSLEEIRARYRGTVRYESEQLSKRRNSMLFDPSIAGDEELLQKMINLDYAALRLEQPAKRDIVRKVTNLVSEITDGFPIEYKGIHEDERGLFPIYGTPDGVLPFDVLSKGTQSILQCLSYLLLGYAEFYDFPPDLEQRKGTLIIDEFDAHLHPSWQQGFIPALTKHFPNLQIFCSTHSPLALAGLKSGQVHLLKRNNEENEPKVTRNETDIIGWTADEILRNFLNVPNPTDKLTSDNVKRLQEIRRKDVLTREEEVELQQLRESVGQDLLNGPHSAQVDRFSEILKNAGYLSEA